jgi:hypothetical protein
VRNGKGTEGCEEETEETKEKKKKTKRRTVGRETVSKKGNKGEK